MASSIVISTANQLGGLLVTEAQHLYEVSDKIESLQRDLQWMHCFLEDADNRQNGEKVVAMWVAEITDFTYEAEEIIERYVHKVSNPRKNGAWNTIKWLSCVLCDARALHEVGSNIDALRTRIKELISRLQLYGVQVTHKRESLYDNAAGEQRQTYSHTQEDPIGLEKHTEEVVKQLVNFEQVKIVGICGMGGLGKTTLARKVYQDTAIREHFKQRAWVCISKKFDPDVVFREILGGLTSAKDKQRNEIFNLSKSELTAKICEILKQPKSLVVLDDLWTKQDWLSLEPAFGSIESLGGKILMTSRNNGLMKHFHHFGYLYNPGFLDEDDSWKLFKQIVFSKREIAGDKKVTYDDTIEKSDTLKETITSDKKVTSDAIQKNDKSKEEVMADSSACQERGSDQTEQEDGDLKAKKEALGREMLKNCKGLPLAILSLGGILSNKKTIAEWQTVKENVASYLMGDIKHGGGDKGLFAILELSFKDLPFYLKPCFMYLGMFPEDYMISVLDLYHLWEAEGLVTVSADNGDEVGEMCPEDIAELYLNEMVERCLVQVDECWGNGRIRTCRLHDLVRAMCLKKCKEVDFLRIIKHEGSKKPSSKVARSSVVNGKLRRCALYLGETNCDDDMPFDTNPNIDPCIRSLLIFQHGEENWAKRLFSPDLSEFLSRLRVLHLRDTSIPVHDKTPMNFIHLRYLSFRGAKSVNSLPASIWDCKYLETLNLDWDARDVLVSNMFWKLERLRHLFFPFQLNLGGSERLKLKDNQLEQMETLVNFNLVVCKIEDLEKMTSMRFFTFSEIRALSRKEVQHFLNSPMTTTTHVKIPVQLSVEADVINEGASLLTSIQKHVGIGFLRIMGGIDSADNLFKILHNRQLTHLELMGSGIGQEEILEIEKLSHLGCFNMRGFLGEKLSFSSGGFPNLKFLILVFLPNLEDLEIEEGALPKLEVLMLEGCHKLKMIPQSLPNSVHVTCKDPCISGVEKYNICPHFAEAAHVKNPSPSSTST